MEPLLLVYFRVHHTIFFYLVKPSNAETQHKNRSKSASMEPLIDFLAYWERKLWLIDQKLTKILLPQKPLWGAFHPMQ